jgi:hypothetical protein
MKRDRVKTLRRVIMMSGEGQKLAFAVEVLIGIADQAS